MNFDWSKESILIVDDDQDLLDTMYDIFSRLGVTTYAASSGEQALTYLQDEKITLIISDLQMPGMNGDALLKIIKERKINTPFIFITGQIKFTAEKAIALGALGLIYKPYVLKVMLAKVQNILASS